MRTALAAAILLALAAALALWRLRARTRRAETLARLRAAALDSLAHDLRTPLTAVLGAATALESLGDTLDRDRRTALAATAADGARALDRAIGDMLESARGGAAGRADLRACAASALRRAGDVLNGHEVSVRIDPEATAVAADPRLLELALANLIVNAARHGPAAGRIVVESRAGRGRVVLSVADEGSGAPKAVRMRRRFPRAAGAAPGGPGLGLPIVRGFAEAMGGRLRFAAQGARAEILLPRPSPLPRGAAAGDNAAPVGRHV